MVDPRRGASTVLTLAQRVVAVAARLVPLEERREWVREWQAELWHLQRSLEPERRASARGRAALLIRSLGSVADALQFRIGDAQSWSESFAHVATGWRQHFGAVAIALFLLSVGIAADALLIASVHVLAAVPRSAWSGLAGQTQLLILFVAVACGVLLIVASAAAAAQLLASVNRSRRAETSMWVAELLLVAVVTGWLGRWFAAFGMRSAMAAPYPGDWLAAVDLDAAVTFGWMISWTCGLAALCVLRMRRGRRAVLAR